MLIRLNTFAKGFSGVRPLLAETMLKMLNAGVTPYVPSKGSLGASGDLAPLAHIAAMSLIPVFICTIEGSHAFIVGFFA